MTGVSAPDLVARRRESAGEPAGALVLLHGRGADENDLFPLLDLLDPERRLLGITPGGPLHLPPGGRHWYTLGGIPTPDPETFHATAPRLAAFLDGLPVPMERVVLGGFSQGAVMSYALGLGSGRPRPRALIALSGFIPTVFGWELDVQSPFPPIAIAHGTYDPVISVEFGRDARARLEAAGADVWYRESPIEHWIDPQILPELRARTAAAFSYG